MKYKLKNIYFDLDGPILDVSSRYFFVHKNICRELCIPMRLNIKEYWAKKRTKIPLCQILNLSDKNGILNKYKKKWLKWIEDTEALKLDKVFSYVKEVLFELKNRYNLTLVTLRRNPQNALNEVKKLGLDKYFKDIHVVIPNNKYPHILKYKKIISSGNFDNNSILVGDTEVDILAARKLGIKSVAVLSGIRNKKTIFETKPDYIIHDIRGLLTDIGL